MLACLLCSFLQVSARHDFHQDLVVVLSLSLALGCPKLGPRLEINVTVSEWRGRITLLVSPVAFLAMQPSIQQAFLTKYTMGIVYVSTTTPLFFFFSANLTSTS